MKRKKTRRQTSAFVSVKQKPRKRPIAGPLLRCAVTGITLHTPLCDSRPDVLRPPRDGRLQPDAPFGAHASPPDRRRNALRPGVRLVQRASILARLIICVPARAVKKPWPGLEKCTFAAPWSGPALVIRQEAGSGFRRSAGPGCPEGRFSHLVSSENTKSPADQEGSASQSAGLFLWILVNACQTVRSCRGPRFKLAGS